MRHTLLIKNLKIAQFIITIILTFSVFSCETIVEKISRKTNQSELIRVRLIIGKELIVQLRKDIVVMNEKDNSMLKFPWDTKKIDIKISGGIVMLNDRQLLFPIRIYSIKDRFIIINKKKYLGLIRVIPSENDLEVIDSVPVETYLMSVIPSEIPLSCNIEALKAQAIVARTYAQVFIDKFSGRRDFDVDNTTNYQVYGGYDFTFDYKYIKKLETVLKETAGMIVVYNEKPILAYFHSNSGGILLSGREYFGSHSDFPYLAGKEDPFSLDYPGNKWEYNMTFDEFKSIFDLRQKGADIDKAGSKNNKIMDATTDIIFGETRNSPNDLTDSDPDIQNKKLFSPPEYHSSESNKNNTDLTDDYFIYRKNGFLEKIIIEDKTYSAREIRFKIGARKIKSERFKVYFDNEKERIIFKGIGYGHGVGMSQWGAHGMAEKGFNYRQIIFFYYPNTKIRKLPDINN